MPDVPKDRLWNEIPDRMAYPDNEKWYSHLLDQYKLYVEMADRISQRRTTANSYFLSVNSAILAFVGYLTSKDSSDYLWLLATAGVTLTFLWHSIITSYRNLNSAKWEVVHEIEKRCLSVRTTQNGRLYNGAEMQSSTVPYRTLNLACLGSSACFI